MKALKAQPGSSDVHVPAPGEEKKKPDVKPTAVKPNPGVIGPPVANLEAEIVKEAFGQEVRGDQQLGDNNATASDLYGMQEVISGIDYELAYGEAGTEENAKATALSNLEQDPQHYKKKWMEQESTSDDLAKKDTQENEDEGKSNWPVGLNVDLGSGQARENGHIGLDKEPSDYGTLYHDLASPALPFDDGTVAKIRLVNVLHEMDEKDQKPLLSEIQRVLMPGGQFHYEGPNQIYNYPEWLNEDSVESNEDEIQKVEGQPLFRQRFTRVAVPDAATSDDAEPRIGIAQYDQLPADALLAMDALGYYWSDSTSSGRGNRLSGYPSQGALVSRREEEEDNQVATKSHDPKTLETIEEGLKALEDFFQEEALEKSIHAMIDNAPPMPKDATRLEKVFKTREVPIRKADNKKQVVYCVVLAPDELDSQDDWMTADDIEDAAHHYMIHARTIGKDHSEPIENAYPVESYIAPQDLEWGDGPYGPQSVKKGSWVIGIKVADPKEWQKVENGEYQGVSVGGFGLRE
jgi:SAM-dependent methyltransferase